MRILPIPNGPVQTNCHIVDMGDGTCFLIDAPSPAGAIVAKLEKEGLTPSGVYLTHAHFDHVTALSGLMERWPGLEVALHEGDAARLTREVCLAEARYCGLAVPEEEAVFPEKPILLKDGDEIGAGFVVMATPGHTPGCVCYVNMEEKIAFTGDTLFRQSVGRTDLGGDHSQLISSLGKLASLPDDMRCFPGHGWPTTIGDEKRDNPWLFGL